MQRIRSLLCLFAIVAICLAVTACSDDKPADNTPSSGGGDQPPAETPEDPEKPADPAPAEEGAAGSCGGAKS